MSFRGVLRRHGQHHLDVTRFERVKDAPMGLVGYLVAGEVDARRVVILLFNDCMPLGDVLLCKQLFKIIECILLHADARGFENLDGLVLFLDQRLILRCIELLNGRYLCVNEGRSALVDIAKFAILDDGLVGSDELDDGFRSAFDEELEALRDVVGDRDFHSILAVFFRCVEIALWHELYWRQSYLRWVETLAVSVAQTVRQLDQ